MKRVLLLAASIAAAVFALASTSPASAGSVTPPAGCVVASINPDGSETLTCAGAQIAPATAPTVNASPAQSTTAAVAPSNVSYVGTVVTTAGKQKSPGYAVDLVRRGSWNLSAIMLDSQSKIPITFGVSVMSKTGISIGMLKLPQPSPTPGANKLGTYGVFIETRI